VLAEPRGRPSRSLAIGIIALALATPPAILAVHELTDRETQAQLAGADGKTVVAVVDGNPIARSSFEHWLAVSQASRSTSPQARVREVMGFLISSEWVLQEARLQGVKVTETEVVQRFSGIKSEQFHLEAALTTFMRKTNQTESDLRFRVELSLLSSKLQAVLIFSTGELQSAVDEFTARWKSRTICAPGYVTKDCRNS
jgi:hypothetical protein